VITDNVFVGTAASGTQSGIFIMGGNVQGYAPVSPSLPTISGNTFADGLPVPLFVRTHYGTDPNGLLTVAYAEDFIANNLSGDGETWAYVLEDGGNIRLIPVGTSQSSDAYIGSSLEVLNTYQTTGVTIGSNSPTKRDTISDNDTIVVQTDGVTNVTLHDDNLTIRAREGSGGLNLTLADAAFAGAPTGFTKAVLSVTLADHSTGQGANVGVTGNGLNNTIVGNSGANELRGGGGDDVLNGRGGNDALIGGAGADTALFSGGTLTRGNDGKWTVTGPDGAETLTGIERVVINGKGFVLVDDDGEGFQSIQAAIDAAKEGDTILIAPGSYTETASLMPYGDTGSLFINKAGLTLQGIDEDGQPITSVSGVKATVTAGAQAGFGANFFVGPDGDGVTIRGIKLQAGEQTDNKLLEVWGDNFTVEPPSSKPSTSERRRSNTAQRRFTLTRTAAVPAARSKHTW
jgi:hypothetical protein